MLHILIEWFAVVFLRLRADVAAGGEDVAVFAGVNEEDVAAAVVFFFIDGIGYLGILSMILLFLSSF